MEQQKIFAFYINSHALKFKHNHLYERTSKERVENTVLKDSIFFYMFSISKSHESTINCKEGNIFIVNLQ